MYLLQIDELGSLNIFYDFAKLLPQDFTQDFELITSVEQFTPAPLIDELTSPLSWRYTISYKEYLGKYQDKAEFLSILSKKGLTPIYLCMEKYKMTFFGTDTLINQIDTIYSDGTEYLRYYFTDKEYSAYSLIYRQKFESAILLNFNEVIYLPSKTGKGELSTQTAESIKKIAEELEGVERNLAYFCKHKEVLKQYYVNSTGTTKTRLHLKTSEPGGIQFWALVFPFTVCKLKADKKLIELTDSQGNVHQFRSGYTDIPTEQITYHDTSMHLNEHTIFMYILYGIDTYYFY